MVLYFYKLDQAVIPSQVPEESIDSSQRTIDSYRRQISLKFFFPDHNPFFGNRSPVHKQLKLFQIISVFMDGPLTHFIMLQPETVLIDFSA